MNPKTESEDDITRYFTSRVILQEPTDRISANIMLSIDDIKGILVKAVQPICKGDVVSESAPFVKFITKGDVDTITIENVMKTWVVMFALVMDKLHKTNKDQSKIIMQAFNELHPRTIPELNANLQTALISFFSDSVVIDDQLIQAVKIKNNTFPCSDGFGMYRYGSKFNHSCDPNCLVTMKGDHMIVETIRNIEKDEELTIPYYLAGLNESCTERRIIMANRFGFECSCARCAVESQNKSYKRSHREIVKDILWAKPHCWLKDCTKSDQGLSHSCRTCGIATYCSEVHMKLDFRKEHEKICPSLPKKPQF